MLCKMSVKLYSLVFCVLMSGFGRDVLGKRLKRSLIPSIPGRPQSLRVRAQTDTIIATWLPPGHLDVVVHGYRLEYGTNRHDMVQINLDYNMRHFIIPHLEADTTYTLIVQAFNNQGLGPPAITTATTESETESLEPLFPPIGLHALAVTYDSVNLTWVDMNEHSNGNYIYTVAYKQIESSIRRYVNSTATNTYVGRLIPNTIYEFSVKVTSGQRSSSYGMSTRLMTHGAVPGPPINLQGQALGPDKIQLSWDTPVFSKEQIQSYEIYYAPLEYGMSHISLTPPQTYYTLTDLTPDTIYSINVAAKSSAGESEAALTIEVRTETSAEKQNRQSVQKKRDLCSDYPYYQDDSPEEQQLMCMMHAGAEECSGNGRCVCGNCYCNSGFFGAYCEGQPDHCDYFNGLQCAGRGHCLNGECYCSPGWTGQACGCTMSVENCRSPNGVLCNNHGLCTCGKCVCADAYHLGKFCDQTPWD